jgi:transposase-like protein
MSKFKRRFICNDCDSQFEIEPINCPVCEASEEISKKIKKMKNEKEYISIKREISALVEGNRQFDLFNLLNRTKHAVGL